MIPSTKPVGQCKKCRRDLPEAEVDMNGRCPECVICSDVYNSIDRFMLEPAIKIIMTAGVVGPQYMGNVGQEYKRTYQHKTFESKLWTAFPSL
jgi:hypothetical protein